MATTNINATQFNNMNPGIRSVTDLSTGAAVADIVNGNSTANNGSLCLFILGTATDTVNVTMPEEASADPIHVTANVPIMAGPFETDLYGSVLAFKAGAVTTKILPVQFPELP